MKLKKIGIALAAVAMLTLSGCAGSFEDNRTPVEESNDYKGFTIEEIKHELKDGRTVTCLVEDGGYDGGITCDWENASLPADR